MKRFNLLLLSALAALLLPAAASAQYYQIANRLQGLISPALSGSVNYKGFVEVAGVAGIGDNRANFLELSTSQGFRYSNWFYMGAGMGVAVAMAHQTEWLGGNSTPYPGRDYAKTKCMIPVFSDFRFNIGTGGAASVFIGIRLGAAWLLGSSYLLMDDACMTSETQFYMRPAIGVRIPLAKGGNQAFNAGVTYQMLTSNNNYYRQSNSVTLNNIGLSLAFEW